MATREIDLGRIHVASTRRLRGTIKKDGVAWTGIDSVTLTFENSDRETQFDRSMVVYDDAAGIWDYDITTSDIESGMVGEWTIKARVIDGTIDISYPYEISLTVTEQP